MHTKLTRYTIPELHGDYNDFELCADTGELKQTLRCIDDNGYTMVTVTQDGAGTYTVFFCRPARE